MIQFLRKLLFNTWFLAGIPAVISFFFLHSSSFEYRITEANDDLSSNADLYYDLNGDSVSEILRTGKGIPFYNIIVLDYNHNVFDQWNLKDYIDYDLSKIFFGDYDNDSFKEIYIFTYRDDSLFLNVNEFFQPSGTVINGTYITKISNIDGKVTSTVYPAGFYDNDDDGVKELYFSIYTGFGLEPRKIFRYNFVQHSINSTSFTGTICQSPFMEDIDSDGKPEIFGDVSASGNFNTPVPFTDYSAWLMVFGSDLSLKFPPVEFPGFTNYLQVRFLQLNDFTGFVLLISSGSASSSEPPGVMTYTADGRRINFKSLSDLGFRDARVRMELIDGRIFITGSKILELNTNLDIVNSVASPLKTTGYSYSEDINNDGKDELLLYSFREKKIAVFNTSLRELTETSIDLQNDIVSFSHYYSPGHGDKLALTSPQIYFLLELSKNKFYYLSYLAYPGIYLFFLFFILIIRKLQTIQIVEKEALKQRLLSLQLKAIKSQLDPHFTFNTLNSVASLIYFNERQEAYEYLIKFTSLLRNMLNDAELIYRSIDDEINFVRTYLDLEKLRFGDKFSYFIETSREVKGDEEVPKLVLFTFAENAIKHGLIPKDKAGMLHINIDRVNSELKISIEDNGIGRKKSEGQSTSTKKGLKLTTEFYEILNNMDHGRIQYHITDLYDSAGIASGTRVDVLIELAQNGI